MTFRELRSVAVHSRIFIFAGVLFALITTSKADPITFEIGVAPGVKTAIAWSTNALNGTSLQGQTLSLDFVFGSVRFGRLFTITDSSLTAMLTLNTNGSGVVGFLDGTGYLFNQNGQQRMPLQKWRRCNHAQQLP